MNMHTPTLEPAATMPANLAPLMNQPWPAKLVKDAPDFFLKPTSGKQLKTVFNFSPENRALAEGIIRRVMLTLLAEPMCLTTACTKVGEAEGLCFSSILDRVRSYQTAETRKWIKAHCRSNRVSSPPLAPKKPVHVEPQPWLLPENSRHSLKQTVDTLVHNGKYNYNTACANWARKKGISFVTAHITLKRLQFEALFQSPCAALKKPN